MVRSSKRLLVIAGPTAVGKTALALLLAQKLDTVILSADSRQVFREMTLGTAKPSAGELALVPHYFINSHSITEEYNAARFGEEALALIHTLFREKDHVILCGGSGLYIKAVCEGFDDIPAIDDAIREQLNQDYEQHGIAWLQDKMKALDPVHYEQMEQQNPHRLIRALEVKIGTGKSIRDFQGKNTLKHDFEIVKIGLELPREELYSRIDQRMDQMIDAGLFAEAEALYPYRAHQALQTVGYQEIFRYLEGQYDREEAIRLLKRNSRRYAKRQLTWFKRDAAFHWFAPQPLEPVLNFLAV